MMQNRSNLSSVPLRFRMRADQRNFIPVFDWKEMSMAQPMVADSNPDREIRMRSARIAAAGRGFQRDSAFQPADENYA
jgi:hypothetical protein